MTKCRAASRSLHVLFNSRKRAVGRRFRALLSRLRACASARQMSVACLLRTLVAEGLPRWEQGAGGP